MGIGLNETSGFLSLRPPAYLYADDQGAPCQFLVGRAAIETFLTEKWSRETGYRLRKELFSFAEDKVLCCPYMRIGPPASDDSTVLTPRVILRLPCSSGTSGMTAMASGGGPMGSRTGRLRKTA